MLWWPPRAQQSTEYEIGGHPSEGLIRSLLHCVQVHADNGLLHSLLHCVQLQFGSVVVAMSIKSINKSLQSGRRPAPKALDQVNLDPIDLDGPIDLGPDGFGPD